MKFSEVVNQTRVIIQDTAPPYRNDETDMVGFVNNSLQRIATLRPDLFVVCVDSFATTEGMALHKIPAASRSIRFVEAFTSRIGEDGPRRALKEIDRVSLNRRDPNWTAMDNGQAKEFTRYVRDQNAFFLFPPAQANQFIEMSYAQAPGFRAINYNEAAEQDTLKATDQGDEIALLPDNFFSAAVDGAVLIASSIDDEAVNSGRVQLFYEQFTGALGVSTNIRNILDREAGGHRSTKILVSDEDGPNPG